MSKPVVLITGGTSQNGRALAKLLLPSNNFTVRLDARDPSKLSPLVSQGAEAILPNSTLDSMQSALKGVTSVFFIYPALTGGPGDTLVTNFFLALSQPHSSVTHIVYLSSMRAYPNDEQFELAYKHWRNEQQLIQSQIPYTILRPTYFHENLVTNFAEEIKRNGEYRTSASESGVWTSVAVCDVAAVAMAAIANPELHASKTYELREEAVTHEQVAEKISRVSGKKVKMVNLTPEEHYALVMKLGAGAGNATALANQVVRSDKEKRDGVYSALTPDLEIVLGRKGVTLDAFLEEHTGEFKSEH